MVTKKKHSLAAKTEQSEGGSLIRNQKLRQLYLAMLQCRALLNRAEFLNGAGTLSAPRAIRYEATEVGCAIDLRAHDAIAFAGEDWLAALLKKASIPTHLGGRKRNVLEFEERFTEQLIAGAEARQKLRGVIIAFADEMEPSSDSWKEALAAAGKRKLPILFVQRKKLSGKSSRSRSGSLLVNRSFPLISVDGHDVVAVYRVAFEAIQRARRGGGPTLIECEPYTLEDDLPRLRNGFAHAVRRPESAPRERTGTDPLCHMEQYLMRKRLFQSSWKDRQLRSFAHKLDKAFGAMQQGDMN